MIIAIAVVILAIILFRGCGANKSYQQRLAAAEKLRKQSVDSAEAEFKVIKAIKDLSIQQWRDSAESLLSEIEVLRYERNAAWQGLEKNKVSADKLIASIKNKRGADSIACLELAEKYSDAAAQVWSYKLKSDQLILKLDTVSRFKDKIISEQQELTQAAITTKDYFKNQYDSLYQSFKKISPSGSFSGGFTVMGSKTNPLSGAGVAGLFTQANGNSIGVNALMLRDSELYFQGTYLWRFSLRKKK